VLTHLPPNTLSTITLVSRRFHDLVTTPHAWRVAFGRYFPGIEALPSRKSKNEDEVFISQRPEFTRLTAFGSWRSEYTLRPKLLRALERGKPSQMLAPTASPRSSRLNSVQNAAQLTYSSRLLAAVNHIDCNFDAGPNKQSPRIVHGTSDPGKATLSDPVNAKVEFWGSGDPAIFSHFEDIHVTESLYGLGSGTLVGVPNQMDVSQVHGMVVGEGYPGGAVYYRSTHEQRGRHLITSREEGNPELGVPKLDMAKTAVTCVWLAKTVNVPTITNGMIGMMSGSSTGVVTAYSTGSMDGSRGHARGETTVNWVLSPGVPIIAISVDENYNLQRRDKQRVWATALNALGEVFCLRDLPTLGDVPNKASCTASQLYEWTWKVGRSCYWSSVEPSRRTPNPDLDTIEGDHATYSPRSSCDDMGLSSEQIFAETKEIESFMRRTPKQIRELCSGWDMRRRLEVDFAGDDGNYAGEAVFVFECGLEDNAETNIKRYRRSKMQVSSPSPPSSTATSPAQSPKPQVASIFGASTGLSSIQSAPTWSFSPKDTGTTSISGNSTPVAGSALIEVWKESKLSLGGLKAPTITCTAIDKSSHALTATFEDPLLSLGASTTSSPETTPTHSTPLHTKASDIVGQRSRFIAVGTTLGSILVWNMRASTTKTIRPVRIITTPDVREVSCLALTALYLVHGDREGVVQAWDPLASTMQPIRTLHSRFSSRHRRQLNDMLGQNIQPGSDLFAAGAVALDPDATILRGVVALGTQMHYWSYSSSDATRYKFGKRRLRRSPRGSNQAGDRMSRLGRDEIKDYIHKEQVELAHDEKMRKKENKRMAGRFGTELLGPDATEEEIIAYATLLSQEAAMEDQVRALSSASSDNAKDIFSSSPTRKPIVNADEDADLAKALMLSLHDADPSLPSVEERVEPTFDIPLKYAKKKGSKMNRSPLGSPTLAGSSRQPEVDDLDYAIQLSRAEMESLSEIREDFPELERRSSDETGGSGKTKGKGRRRS
jgi:hypothetical protein